MWHHIRFHTTFSLHMFLHKLKWYRKWHGFKWHQHIHATVLGAYIFVIAMASFGSFFAVTHPSSALASSLANWDLNTASEYTYDSSKIDFTGGVAELTDHRVNTNTLTAIYFQSATNGYALGSNGTILHTSDGTTWSAQASGTTQSIYGVYFTSATNGYAVGGNGTILHTSDGTTWSPQTSGTTRWLAGVFFTSATNGYATGDAGTILHTSDGTTWSPQTSGTTQWLWRTYFTSATNGYAVGGNGTILHTSDGTTWSPQTSGTTQGLEGISFTSATNGYVLGNSGTILHTSDGTTWSAQASGITQSLWDISFTSATNGYVVGNSGAIFHTSDGTTWSAQNSGTTLNRYATYFTSATNGYVVGTSGTIVHTTDGTNWSSNAPVIDNPTVTANISHKYNVITGFTEARGSGSTGNIQYEISNDNGITWYWWNGSAWTAANGTYTQSNPASTINSYISSFTGTFGAGTHDFKWKAFLNSDGNQETKLDNVSVTIEDTLPPNNVASVNGFSQQGGASINSGDWHNNPNPYFTWPQPSDNADTANGETASGVWGYSYCFSTNIGCSTGGGIPAGNEHFQPSDAGITLVNDQTYYLRLATWDNDGNVSSTSTLFTYKFDNVAPTTISSIDRNPVGWTSTNSFSFTWSVSADADSGLKGYEYKRQTDASWTFTASASASAIQAYQNGTNVFMVKALDNAGNESSVTQINYYYAQNAPTAPQNLQVTPNTSTLNSFTFNWQLPTGFAAGQISGYRWSVNALPSASNTTFIADTTTGAIPAATQQGLNTFYVVAVDVLNNVNYANYTSIQFEADTTAPGVPLNLLISDISNRNSTPPNWALAISWNTPSTGSVDHYIIQRSLDQVTWTQAGTAVSTDFAEAELDNATTYYYRVLAVDNAAAESVPSDAVSGRPTGKYTVHPDIRPPDFTVTATSATITWSTDRASSSFIQYGKTTGYGSSNGSPDSVTTHTVTISGLDPGTEYHFRQQSYDDARDYDISTAVGPDMILKTLPAPGISDVKITDIGLTNATVSWQTTSSATSTLKYGKNTGYGTEISDTSGSALTTHTIRLTGLDDSSTYHFKIFGTDTDGNQMHSDDYSFDTLTFPKIDNLMVNEISGNTATLKVTWDSNVPTTSTVQYSDTNGHQGEVSQILPVLKHEVVVPNVKDNMAYSLSVKGRDEYGNEVAPLSYKIRTDYDTTPPAISAITSETSISGFGSDAKAQIVVSWNTDEPATSQVEYSKGVSGDTYSMATGMDSSLSLSHVVVISDLDPSSSYYFRVVSQDASKNQAKSDANSVLTEQAQSSVFDLVLKSFESTLGWMFGGSSR